ncbi:MAG TPA: cell division protein FtsL [Bacillota bacterium]|nr:cell division protein FtsL [Bacillota bacterium]
MECSYARLGELGRDSARRRSSRTMRLMSGCGLVAVLAVALCVVVLAERVAIVRASDSRDRARARAESLKNEWERMSLELARITSLDRVDQVARAELGMVDPPRMGVVLVDARPMLSAANQPIPPSDTADVSQPPTVLANVAAVVEQMAVAAVSNLIAAWFVVPTAQLPSILE